MKTQEQKLRSKLGYGVADIYGGGAFLIISIMYLYFLTDIVFLEPWMAGLIPFIGRFWDAITDPLMGRIVDRTRSKFGAKRFYLLIGSFVASATFMLVWVNLTGPDWFQFIFYTLTFVLFSTGFTIVMVPYNALLPDMVTDYHLRGQYTAVRMIFSALSAILGGLIPNMIITNLGGGTLGYLIMGIVFGLIFFLCLFLTFLNTWELPLADDPIKEKKALKHSLTVFKNRAFRIYLGIFLFGQGSVDFIMALVLYFLTYVLFQEGQYILVMSGVLSSQLIAMFLYQFLLKKHSKKVPAWIGFPIQIVATLAMFFFAYEGASIWPIVFLSFLLGFGTAAGTVVSFAILADMADVDELITSQRRAGTYSGMATFSRKIANGIALGLVGVLLTIIGYNGELDVQAPLTVMGLRLMFIVLPVIFVLFALFFVYKYPVSVRGFAVLREEIDRRKGLRQDTITDEDMRLCEAMTGYDYDNLWNKDNAGI